VSRFFIEISLHPVADYAVVSRGRGYAPYRWQGECRLGWLRRKLGPVSHLG
jgi:hypothetical protein